MARRTKIVCTLGPASSSPEVIRDMIAAGMDVARLNFSHGTHEDHEELIHTIRSTAREMEANVAILQDLQGPKIRIGEVADGGVLLHKGQELILTSRPIEESTAERVFVSYATLAQDVDPGGRILIDDGQIELVVRSVDEEQDEVITEVAVAGPLRSRKGVNLPHIRTSTPSLTEKDLDDLEFGLHMDVDIVALSFVRTQYDVRNLIARIRDSGKNVSVVAKIEKPEAVRQIDEILEEADGIMVARGDLGIEIPMARVPGVQKEIIEKCLEAAKPVITATQMLESMIDNPRPTRAEASDVANAVLDGSDAVMLSGETAVGKHPARVVQVMSDIIQEAEAHRRPTPSIHDGHSHWVTDEEEQVTEAVSYTAFQLAEQVGAKAIACLTASGTTARAVARHRPNVPVYAFTDDPRVLGRLGIVWGTEGIHIPFQRDTDAGVSKVHRELRERGIASEGDVVVITAGMPLPAKGRTNMVHVTRI